MPHVAARPDTREMVIVHRVFRREFGMLPEMVACVGAGDTARAVVIAAHLEELSGMLHHHHAGEDELVWPRLHERAQVPAGLLARMEEQHGAVSALLHRVDELAPRWTAAAGTEVRDELVAVLRELSAALDGHLAEEEREVLPLIEAHLTTAEWAELGQRGMASIPKPRLLVLLGHLLEETSPEERRTFLAKAPAPARVAFRLVGRRKWASEVAVLRQGIRVPQQRQG